MNNVYLSKPGTVTCAGLDSDELWNSVVCGNQQGIKKVTAVSGDEFFVGKIADEKLEETTARFSMRIHRIQEMALNQISGEVVIVAITKSTFPAFKK